MYTFYHCSNNTCTPLSAMPRDKPFSLADQVYALDSYPDASASQQRLLHLRFPEIQNILDLLHLPLQLSKNIKVLDRPITEWMSLVFNLNHRGTSDYPKDAPFPYHRTVNISIPKEIKLPNDTSSICLAKPKDIRIDKVLFIFHKVSNS